MKNPIGPLLLSMLFFITFLLLSNYAFGKTKSQWLNENPCMIKTITTSVTKDGVTTVTKEEVLSCLDIVIEEIDYTLGIVEGEERNRIEHAINTVETVVLDRYQVDNKIKE